MDTTTYRMPRISRLKAAIGAALATLAIAGVAQGATAESASAMKPECSQYEILAAEAFKISDREAFQFWLWMWDICEGD